MTCCMIMLAAVCFAAFWGVDRLRGTVFVTVGGEESPVGRVACRYENGSQEKVTYENNGDPVNGIPFDEAG